MLVLVGAALFKLKNEVVKTLRGWNHVMQPLQRVMNNDEEANTRRYKQSSMCQHETDLWVQNPVRVREKKKKKVYPVVESKGR